MLLKITWKLDTEVPEKAGVPEYWRVPKELKALNLQQLKAHLVAKYCYDIKQIEVMYP